MLPLDSHRWRELDQAYGLAHDVPRLLEHLGRVADDERGELWVGLWATLCGRGAVYSASYAAVPHLVAYARGQPAPEAARAIHLVAAIEAGRHARAAAPMPSDLAASYADALAGVTALVIAAADEPWDADTAQIFCGSLAIAKGHPRLGSATLSLEPVVHCPVCGSPHPPAGWDLQGG